MSSPIRPAKDRDLLKDLDALLIYAPPGARENPPVGAAYEPSIKQPPQSRGGDAAASPSSGDVTVQKDLPCRRALEPDLVPEPKPLKGDPATAIALRLSGVTAIAALVAWVVVTLPGMVSNLRTRCTLRCCPIPPMANGINCRRRRRGGLSMRGRHRLRSPRQTLNRRSVHPELLPQWRALWRARYRQLRHHPPHCHSQKGLPHNLIRGDFHPDQTRSRLP